MNKERAIFFEDHKDKQEGFFTSDNQPFFTEKAATHHATNLGKATKGADKVDKVTREEYEAWKKAGGKEEAFVVPKQEEIAEGDSDGVKAAKEKLNGAIGAYAKAVDYQTRLPKNTGAEKREKAAEDVAAAEAAVKAAQAELEAAVKAAQAELEAQ